MARSAAPADPAPPTASKVETALSSSVEELLSLPRSELESLLTESGAASSKVLLSLIYRLGALERQLGALGSSVRRANVAAPPPTAAANPPVSFTGGAKSDLLEQVFRKNLSLRQRDGA